MSTEAYTDIIREKPAERARIFMTTAKRLDTRPANVEKDFWACWALNTLYHRLPDGGPRLLFKGGTSLSKAYGLINRFSEDIDVTVFPNDLGHPGDTAALAALSNNKRKKVLDKIAEDCSRYVTTDLLAAVAEALDADTQGQGRVEVDADDGSGQSLLVWFPRAHEDPTGYVRPAVKIESGAKSALEPNRLRTVAPYIADDAGMPVLTVPDITTIHAERTFWDKVAIAHGYRNWHVRRGKLYQDGRRISRHYFDLHALFESEVGPAAAADLALGRDCIEHAQTFFRRKDFMLETAAPGTFVLRPSEGMVEGIARDYESTKHMVFGDAPGFDDIMASVGRIEDDLNARQ